MMAAATEFRDGGGLTPQDRAFSDLVYREPGQDPALSAALMSSSPIVIGSPVLSGKSTLLNMLCDHMSRVDSSREELEVDCRKPKGMAEGDLRELIGEVLQSRRTSSFSVLVESRRRANRSFQKSALRFRGADRLQLPALRWLLAGVSRHAQRPRRLETAGLQILIDGAFTTQTLPSGPDSDFLLAQAIPGEFSRRGQSRFFKTRFEAHQIGVTSKALAELHAATKGDKYLTQVIGRRLTEDLSEGARIDASVMRDALSRAVSSPTWAGKLKRSIVKQVRKEKEWFRALARGTSAQELWADGNKEARNILFKSGVLRRVSPIAVEERCEIVMQFVREAFGRLEGVDHLLDHSLSLDGVASEYGSAMRKCKDQVRRFAALGMLRRLHCGSGLVVGPGRVHIDARTLSGGSYEGFLEVDEGDLPAKAKEVWFMRWTRTTRKYNLKSQLRFWPVENSWREGG